MNRRGHHAPELIARALTDPDRREIRMRGEQVKRVAVRAIVACQQLSVQRDHDQRSIRRMQGALHHQDIAREDAAIHQRLVCHLHKKVVAGCRMSSMCRSSGASSLSSAGLRTPVGSRFVSIAYPDRAAAAISPSPRIRIRGLTFIVSTCVLQGSGGSSEASRRQRRTDRVVRVRKGAKMGHRSGGLP